uniref:Uncharacterized protein n=1 Tax=Glossina austeni TaxID=7395 RepID=A0A1A9UVV4_GLOAU
MYTYSITTIEINMCHIKCKIENKIHLICCLFTIGSQSSSQLISWYFKRIQNSLATKLTEIMTALHQTTATALHMATALLLANVLHPVTALHQTTALHMATALLLANVLHPTTAAAAAAAAATTTSGKGTTTITIIIMNDNHCMKSGKMLNNEIL